MAFGDTAGTSMLQRMIEERKQKQQERQAANVGESLAGGRPAAQQQAASGDPADSWDAQRGMLMNVNLDQRGQAKLAELNKQTEALENARDEGKLRPEEFTRAISDVQRKGEQFNWDLHKKPEGTNPGDIIEDQGVRKLRMPDGSLDPIGYTPQYVIDNVVPIGDTGNLLIPVSPREGYKVMAKKDWARDPADERDAIADVQKAIDEKVEQLADLRRPNQRRLGEDGKEYFEPFSKDQMIDMSVEAAEIITKQRLQAKDVYRTIMDGGAAEGHQSVVREKTTDPFQREQEMRFMLREQAEAKERAFAEGRGGPPTPTPSPMMPLHAGAGHGGELPMTGGAQAPMAPQPPQAPGEEAAPAGAAPAQGSAAEQMAAILAGQGERPEIGPGGVYTPAERGGPPAPVDPQDWAAPYMKAGKPLPVIDTGGSFANSLVQSGTVADPVAVAGIEDRDRKLADAPEGVVAEDPTGTRWMKLDGRFYKVPWSEDQLRSQFMLDREGEQVIDPNTGQAAPGVLSQLAAGGHEVRNPFVSQEQGGGMGMTPEEAGISAQGMREMAEGRAKLGLYPVNIEGPTAMEEGREVVNPYANPAADPTMSLDVQKSQQTAPQVESGARAAASHDMAKQFQDWASQPGLREKVLNPVMIDPNNEDDLAELKDGDTFVPKGSDSTWIKQGDKVFKIEGTSGNATQSQMMQWERFPDLVKKVLSAKPLHVTENVNNLQEGRVFRHGQGIFMIVGGRPVPFPRVRRIRTPGSKPTNDAPLNK